MRDLQYADERECSYIFNAVGNLDELVLEVANVELEVIILSHFDGEEVVVILLNLLAGGVLGEECLSYLLETLERHDNSE